MIITMNDDVFKQFRDFIYEKSGMFYIKPEKCTECIGSFDEPQCVSVCPVDDTCIIDNNYPRYAAA